MRDVAVIGVGINKWGELWEKSFRDIFVEAALMAIDDAKISHIDSMYIGCMSGGLFIEQEHITSLLADYLGVGSIPSMRVESACASGGLAVRAGFLDVASGTSDIVLVGGVEKMTDTSGSNATYALSTAADYEYEAYNGATFPGLYAMIARRYIHQFKIKEEDLASVAVKNHENGLKNPNAQFHQRISINDVMKSSVVAEPLKLLDCSPITDGAACIILCEGKLAKKICKYPVEIVASANATDSIALHQRKDITTFNAVVNAAKKAYKMAGITPSDVDLAEVHDCFTIAEVCVSEGLGFFKKGQGAKAARNGFTKIDGRKPINTSGGLKSKGHPVGATGVAQVIEIVEQLQGRAGDRQIKNARIGLTQNMGGSGGSAVIHIMKLMR